MTAPKQQQELIIVRRMEDEEHHGHSSAWKIAHADFMTAMMAFFLIMWLINVTDDQAKKAIANYFNPVHLSESVTNKKGLKNPEQVGDVDEQSRRDQEAPLNRVSEGPVGEMEAAGDSQDGATAAPKAWDGPQEEREFTAFQDPYAALAKLAEEAASMRARNPDVAVGETGVAGVPGGEVYRDPFDPAYWQMRPTEGPKTETAGEERKAEPVPQGGMPDAGAPSPGALDKAEAIQQPAAMVAPPADPAPAEAEKPVPAPVETHAAAELETELEQALAEAVGSAAPDIEVRRTEEGLLVSLTDKKNFSMFDIGSAVPVPSMVLAMDQIAETLKDRPGDIVIRGHTDGRPFRSETYDNWRLSTARAHMASYMLTRGALDPDRIRRIEGYADRELKNGDDPYAAENRRIEILLKDKT